MTINLMAHLQDYLPNGSLDSVLELGCGSGMLSSLLQKQISADYWLFNDLCDVQTQLAENCRNPLIFIAAMPNISFCNNLT